MLRQTCALAVMWSLTLATDAGQDDDFRTDHLTGFRDGFGGATICKSTIGSLTSYDLKNRGANVFGRGSSSSSASGG